MKKAVLKCKAVVLSMMMAVVVAMALTQCKKATPTETPTTVLPEGETVTITLKVIDDSKLTVTPPSVTFDNGDVIFVASDGKYVGYITFNGTVFEGDITGATAEKPLYFYLLGNRKENDITWTTEDGVTTGCSVNIGNQYNFFEGQPANKQLPVISCAPSMENYPDGTNDPSANYNFTAMLRNKSALVKFKTDVISGMVTLSDMYTQANVDFGAGTITSAQTNDVDQNKISFNTDANGEGWAILLPHIGEITSTASTTAEGYNTATVIIPTINNNAYLSEGISVNLFNPLITPLTFEAKTAGATVTFTKALTIAEFPIEYSLNGGTWTTYSTPITLTNIGDKVMFHGANAAYATDSDYSNFSCTGECYIYGNVMSLIDKEDFATNKELTINYTFYRLFYNNANFYNHPAKTLALPATTLTESCYSGMFRDCINLTIAPALPATTLTEACYSGMFYGCTSLTTAPALPAKKLINACYYEMFAKCESLTTTPALPATTLAINCYYYMFGECTSLTTAPALPATMLAEGCYSFMFKECTSLTTAPTLRTITLPKSCYYQMFNGCTNLNSVTCLATDISAENCTSDWLNGVATTGTFTKAASMTSWTEGSSGIPSDWTIQDY